MMDKHACGRAVRYFKGFRDSPGAVRVAGELQDKYNEAVGCAWPTRETISQMLGADAPEQISKWLRILQNAGAITRVPVRSLPLEKQQIIGRSAKRSQVYVLNFGWAMDVLSDLDEYVCDRQNKVIIQSPLPSLRNRPNTPLDNQTVTCAGDGVVTLIPYDQTLDHTLEDKRGSEGSNLSAYTRERAA
ncbi:hypothetical protein [Mesorhizobium sp. M7A.F.Ca.CA.001.10.2.1]|uniref:hypothetical protein n=1 Tax=Mesorhizobium sp. M7A.F.Ca.CA.001.10.2.1 TaxID=2496720 RepID=UPI000FCC55D9|nr:hypothetical protein [Mesorhizobium sp. M7A.F.Ca.CA.001.10.2.1]RUY89524.1 hypothetical protein EN964_11855 [Mesorhizobium sp. M7A.F.Ca.CA.001.10.2.1]